VEINIDPLLKINMYTNEIRSKSYKGECGAALISALLIGTLLMIAGGALLVTTTMTATTTIDSTAETQAYYAAEAGLQATLNVLRGNVEANPQSSTASENSISFRNAVTRSVSNRGTDSSTLPIRLSRWLGYNYTPSSLTYPDRVSITANYTPMNGMAYSITVEDPDNTPVGTEPERLRIVSTGYGPKGARKELCMLVKRLAIEFEPPATIAVAGGDSMTFDLGSSNASGYSGDDAANPPEPQRPAVAVSGANVAAAATEINDLNNSGGGSQVTPATAGELTSATAPAFLSSANEARSFLNSLQAIAAGSGRYFTTQPSTSEMGTSSSPAFTFVDGNVSLGAGDQGNGMLVVTGTFTASGNTDFKGIILVLGTGIYQQNGNGNGEMLGSIIVARFDRTGSGDFLAPTFQINGGGNSTKQYDSVAVRRALNSAGRQVLGIVER
jgi:hypothetical protein